MKHRGEILVINPIGGMANRMRGLAGGIALARELSLARDNSFGQKSASERELGVDFRVVWLRNWELNARFEDIFMMPEMLEGKIEYPSALKYELTYSVPRRRNLWLSKLYQRRYGAIFLGAEAGQVAEAEKNGPEFIFDRFAAAYSAPKTVGEESSEMEGDSASRGVESYLQAGIDIYPYDDALYRALFRPAEDIAQRVAERTERLGEHRVGVHIRRTDNADSIAASPDGLFMARMDAILDSEPATRFYLATDSEEVKRIFRGRYGERIVSSLSRADRGSVEGIKEAAVELYALAATQLILGSFYSSFSEAASKLGGTRLETLKQG